MMMTLMLLLLPRGEPHHTTPHHTTGGETTTPRGEPHHTTPQGGKQPHHGGGRGEQQENPKTARLVGTNHGGGGGRPTRDHIYIYIWVNHKGPD